MGITLDEKIIIEHRLKQAEDYEAQGKPLHAIQVYTALLEEYPAVMEAAYNLAELYQRLNNINAASKVIETILGAESGNIENRMYAGQFYLKYSMWNEALDVLEQIMPEEESYVSYLRGYAHYKLEEYELSKLNLLNYVIRETDNTLKLEGYLLLVKDCIGLKDYKSAENFLKKIEAAYSSYWEFHYLSAQVYKNIGMIEHAITSAEKTIKLNPKQPDAFALAGQLQLAFGDYKKAERRFYKCIELKEDLTSDIYTGLAEACLKSDKTKDALAYFNTALKIDPENRAALKGKETAEYQLKNNIHYDG